MLVQMYIILVQLWPNLISWCIFVYLFTPVMVFLINKYIKFVVAILICTLLIYLIFYNVFSFVCVNRQVRFS